MLNWRDPWHPRSGGAEVVTHRVLERLCSFGWEIEWFSGGYTGALPREVRDGITHIRRGSGATVHAMAFFHYKKKAAQRFDVVVDQINTVPFFTPLYFGCPVVSFIHQLAREVWFYEAPFPAAIIGYALEPIYLQVYRKTPIITVSNSTRLSLQSLGLRGDIHVIPEAVDDCSESIIPAKNPRQDIVVVCRLNPSKRVDLAIRAASLLRAGGWRGCLHIVGGGNDRYVRSLKYLAEKMLGDQVFFHGKVSNDRRVDLMRESSVLWMASIREGWGLVVTEAACHGTPAVVSDVPGLRDSVKNGLTGRVVTATPTAFATATGEILQKCDYYAANALRDSRQYSWGKTALAFEEVISQYTATTGARV
uniref:Putative Glycosyltransferase, family 4 n=1 Tax=mine drainage metagenome TaxID=410659 RepID=E6Q530_9ZZZZ